MAAYPPLDAMPPPIWNDQHAAAAEQALRDTAVIDHILKKCEACKIQVGQMRADCDGLCDFFTNWLAQYRANQAENPPPLG